jgi:hypothetical protein
MRGRAWSLDRMDKKPGEGFSYIWVSNKALKWLGQRYPNISPACLPCSLSTRCPFPQHKTLLGCIVGFHRDSWNPCVINGVDHGRLQIICKRLCCMLPRYLENSRRLRFSSKLGECICEVEYRTFSCTSLQCSRKLGTLRSYSHGRVNSESWVFLSQVALIF